VRGETTQNNPCAETFPTNPHMSNFDSRYSSYARLDIFFLVRVLVKAKFLDCHGSQIPDRVRLSPISQPL
jgi:hypothetical protein